MDFGSQSRVQVARRAATPKFFGSSRVARAFRLAVEHRDRFWLSRVFTWCSHAWRGWFTWCLSDFEWCIECFVLVAITFCEILVQGAVESIGLAVGSGCTG